MKLFRKITAISLAVMMAAGMIGCQKKTDKDEKPKADSDTQKETEYVANEYIKNPELWATPALTDGQAFQFEIQIVSDRKFDRKHLERSIAQYELGDSFSLLPGVGAEEWGYSITHLDGAIDGAGRKIETNFSGANAPKTPAEALKKMKEFIAKQYPANGTDWYSMNGHYPWHHYAAENGASVLLTEIGENVSNYQLRLAFNRGAARQYSLPWGVDFSNWWCGKIHDYTITRDGENGIWGTASHTQGGHSLNLMERSFLMSYMSGADVLVAEAGGPLSFKDTLGADGFYEITPYGEVCQKFNKFLKANTDMGITYTPIGLVLDYYHGSYSGLLNDAKKSFATFDYTEGDEMTWNLMNMIWPGGWVVQDTSDETDTLINSPYGDSFDVLLQNASQEVLNSYPALVLSGDIKLSSKEVKLYTEYVNQGGILVMNTAYSKKFPEFTESMNYGKGRVIVYGPDYSVDGLGQILKDLLSELSPFTVEGDVQYLTNVKNDTMYVTLINNKGVTKTGTEAAKVDASKKSKVTVTYKGSKNVASVKEIYAGTSFEQGEKSATLTLQAGGMAVLEFQLK